MFCLQPDKAAEIYPQLSTCALTCFLATYLFSLGQEEHFGGALKLTFQGLDAP